MRKLANDLIEVLQLQMLYKYRIDFMCSKLKKCFVNLDPKLCNLPLFLSNLPIVRMFHLAKSSFTFVYIYFLMKTR